MWRHTTRGFSYTKLRYIIVFLFCLDYVYMTSSSKRFSHRRRPKPTHSMCATQTSELARAPSSNRENSIIHSLTRSTSNATCNGVAKLEQFLRNPTRATSGFNFGSNYLKESTKSGDDSGGKLLRDITTAAIHSPDSDQMGLYQVVLSGQM